MLLKVVTITVQMRQSYILDEKLGKALKKEKGFRGRLEKFSRFGAEMSKKAEAWICGGVIILW